jgi:hypothetical protein
VNNSGKERMFQSINMTQQLNIDNFTDKERKKPEIIEFVAGSV